jgi:small subunit ribosomal protein MRP21
MHDSDVQLHPSAIASPVSTHFQPRVQEQNQSDTYDNMGSRCLGELLLRPSSITRTPLCQTPKITRISVPSWTAQRSISSTPVQPAAQPQRKADDVSDFSAEPATEPQQPQTAPRRPLIRRQASPNAAFDSVDSLFADRKPARPTQYAPRPQSTSSDEVRAARSNHVFGARFSDPSSSFRRGGNRSPPKLNFDDMSLPTDLLDPNLSNKPSESASLATQQQETFANYPRLNPTYGRTIELDSSRGRDLVRGIGMLGSLMARNKIRHDMMKQRFHERNGLKRKRLASERWRARFKQGFTSVTRRVSELTGKGW